jgi:hypothetical protein
MNFLWCATVLCRKLSHVSSFNIYSFFVVLLCCNEHRAGLLAILSSLHDRVGHSNLLNFYYKLLTFGTCHQCMSPTYEKLELKSGFSKANFSILFPLQRTGNCPSMSIIGGSEEVVEDNPSYFSLIVNSALLGSTSEMSIKWVRAASRSRNPPPQSRKGGYSTK